MKVKSSKELKVLQKKWYKKLQDSGFEDIENYSKQNLKLKNKILNKANKEQILEFFLMLDSFLIHTKDLPIFDRNVLTLYSNGIYLTQIMKQLRTNKSAVHRIIKKYSGIVKGLIEMQRHNDTFSPIYRTTEDIGLKENGKQQSKLNYS